MLTPLDVHSKQFTARFGRYSAAEVDDFLDLVGQSYDQIYRENAELKERLRLLSEKPPQHDPADIGETLKQTLLMAQKASEDARRNAEEKARLIVENAEREAAAVLDRAQDKVKTFSGGMKRRINIAAGLLHKPQLLFMDEPTVGIDPQSRRRILDMVKELRDGGITVLYTTHYMEEAEELSDRVGIIDQGRLIALGTQAELTRVVGEQETLRLYLAEEASAAAAQAAIAAGDGAALPADGGLSLFNGLPGVLRASAVDHQIIVNVADAGEALPAVVGRANMLGLHVRSVDIEEPNLEAVFLQLTGRGLRD